MNKILLANRILLALLGLSTGLVKLFQMQEEMDIFWAAGFSTAAILVFGVVQIIGALMLISGRTARLGAAILLVTFVMATGVLFVNQIYVFGVFSCLFMVMAGAVITWPTGRTLRTPATV